MKTSRRSGLNRSCRWRRGLLPAVLVAGAAAFAGAAAEAQETVVIGGSGRPPVEVNLDVIEEYGRTLLPPRRLLIPGQPPPPLFGTLVLRPPRGVAAPKLTPPPALATAPPPPPTPAPAPRAAPAPAPPKPAVAALTPPPPPPPPPSAVPTPARAPAPAPREQVAAAPPAPPTPPAPPPPPSVAPAPAPAAPPAAQQQVAALPPVQFINVDDQQALRVMFSGASTRLSPQGEQQLKALADQLGDSDTRLQLKAYGGGSSETVSAARRLSLSRALAVRSYLIEQGIRSTRIDVRALGIAKDGGPAERVDLVLLAR